MNIKQLYYYFFYTLYRAWLNIDNAFGATGLFQTSDKALICMFPVEIWLIFSIGIYCKHLFNIHEHIPFFSVPVLAPLIILFVIKWLAFERGSKWKNYVKEFNEWPKEKNRVGFWLVGMIIVSVFLNFIYAVDLNLQPTGLK